MKSLREIAATTPISDPLEANIVKACLKYLNSLEGARFQKRHGGRARAGEPDITGCIRGQHWEIEVKRPKCWPTKQQDANLHKWSRAGAVACWVTSKDQLQHMVEAWLFGVVEPEPLSKCIYQCHSNLLDKERNDYMNIFECKRSQIRA